MITVLEEIAVEKSLAQHYRSGYKVDIGNVIPGTVVLQQWSHKDDDGETTDKIFTTVLVVFRQLQGETACSAIDENSHITNDMRLPANTQVVIMTPTIPMNWDAKP
jgi:hypothetical protein